MMMSGMSEQCSPHQNAAKSCFLVGNSFNHPLAEAIMDVPSPNPTHGNHMHAKQRTTGG
jgi:hypothetical protein